MYVCVIESQWGFNFHFPVTSDVETLTCLSSLVEWLCSYFAHLLICFLIIESGKIFNMFYTDFWGGQAYFFISLTIFFCRIDVKFNETEFSSFPAPPPPLWILFLVLYLRKLCFTKIIRIVSYFLDGLWFSVLLSCLWPILG